MQKKKLHVKSVIAKVTGQSANESNLAPESEESQFAVEEDRMRTRDITARVRTFTSSTGLGTIEGEAAHAAHASSTADLDTTHSDSDSDAQSSNGSVSKLKSQPCCRIDFELDSTVLEGISETIGIIRSHFCYWDHRNVAALIVTLMHTPPPLSGDGFVDFGSVE